MNSKLKNDSTDYLFKAILSLENEEDCYRFFEYYAQAQNSRQCHSALSLQKCLPRKRYIQKSSRKPVRQPQPSAE